MKERPILFSGAMVRALLNGSKTQTRRVVKPTIKGCGVGVYTHGPWLVVPFHTEADGDPWTDIACPYGAPGDRLWVRETWAYNGQAWRNTGPEEKRREGYVTYAADNAKVTHYFGDGPPLLCPEQHLPKQREDEDEFEWLARKDEYITKYFRRMRPSIHMPRWASRITLDVTGVRVERLNEIIEADAKAEGITSSVKWICHNQYAPRYGAPGVPCVRADEEKSIGEDFHETAAAAYRALWESINGADSWLINPWVWVVSFTRRRAP